MRRLIDMLNHLILHNVNPDIYNRIISLINMDVINTKLRTYKKISNAYELINHLNITNNFTAYVFALYAENKTALLVLYDSVNNFKKIIKAEIPIEYQNILETNMEFNIELFYNQENTNSCSSNALSSILSFILQRQGLYSYPISRLFIYYNERNMEGHVLEDSGAEIHDGVQVLNTIGVCNETEWVYDISKFTIKPDESCYTNALVHKTSAYRPIQQDLSQLRLALIAGFPIVFGFSVYESFESPDVAKTGNMPIPQPTEKCLGGHAVAAVGFDDTRKVFIVRNSWGASWGDKGYFYMPYAFITNPDMTSDFWTITATQDNALACVSEPEPESKPILEQIESACINHRILQLINESDELNGVNRIPSPIPECAVYKRNRNRNKHNKHL
jgi:C1A family cysteine protease